MYAEANAIVLKPDASELNDIWNDWWQHIPGELLGEVSLPEALRRSKPRLVLAFGEAEIDRLLDGTAHPSSLHGTIVYDIGCSGSTRSANILSAGALAYVGYNGPIWRIADDNYKPAYRDCFLAGLRALDAGKTIADARAATVGAWTRLLQGDNWLNKICAVGNLEKLFVAGDVDLRLTSPLSFWIAAPVSPVVTNVCVHVIDVSPGLLLWLQEDPERTRFLAPDKFEDLIADRLAAMDFCVEKIGRTNQSDGGIDLIAYPREAPVPFLLATQVKHSHSDRPVGSGTVRDFHGALLGLPIDVGMIVTNTHFTPDARWFASHRSRIIRLRDFGDLTKWLRGEFAGESALKELPTEIELLPGLTVRLPRPPR
jgi:hypothetical protein